MMGVDVARPWWQRLLMRFPNVRRELEEQDARAAHVEAVRRRSIAVRIRAEQVADDYRKAARTAHR